jgi:hypothetical protein
LAVAGAARADEVDNVIRASNACYLHYFGTLDESAFIHASVETREHVTDCIELFDKTGHMPKDAAVAARSKSYDLADDADKNAHEDFLTCKLGHKPNDQDEQNELRDAMANAGRADSGGWKGIEHYSTSYLQNLHRCAERVLNDPRAEERAGKESDAINAISRAVQAAHAGLLDILKDPESAKFNSNDGAAYSFSSDGSLYAVCGRVNSKNSFGGYTGEQILIYEIPKNTVYTQETGATDAMAKRDCTGGVHSSK